MSLAFAKKYFNNKLLFCGGPLRVYEIESLTSAFVAALRNEVLVESLSGLAESKLFFRASI